MADDTEKDTLNTDQKPPVVPTPPEETAPTDPVPLQREYFFPVHQKTVTAASQEEANEKLAAILETNQT